MKFFVFPFLFSFFFFVFLTIVVVFFFFLWASFSSDYCPLPSIQIVRYDEEPMNILWFLFFPLAPALPRSLSLSHAHTCRERYSIVDLRRETFTRTFSFDFSIILNILSVIGDVSFSRYIDRQGRIFPKTRCCWSTRTTTTTIITIAAVWISLFHSLDVFSTNSEEVDQLRLKSGGTTSGFVRCSPSTAHSRLVALISKYQYYYSPSCFFICSSSSSKTCPLLFVFASFSSLLILFLLVFLYFYTINISRTQN